MKIVFCVLYPNKGPGDCPRIYGVFATDELTKGFAEAASTQFMQLTVSSQMVWETIPTSKELHRNRVIA